MRLSLVALKTLRRSVLLGRAVEGLLTSRPWIVFLFPNKHGHKQAEEAGRGKHPSCTSVLDTQNFKRGWGGSPGLGSSLVWSSPSYRSRSQVRVVLSLGSRPSTMLAARWAGAHGTCRAQSHRPWVFPDNDMTSPGKRTLQTARGPRSQNVTRQKNLVVFSPRARSL